MKINIKYKKIIASVVGMFVVGGIVFSLLYQKIDIAKNDYVSIQYVIYNIELKHNHFSLYLFSGIQFVIPENRYSE
ncbi:MAG: hypothetical protein ACRC92_19525, partial [Peptostreptococcaceae bacterium]